MISVIMPVHKDDSYLLLAIKSVLEQTYEDFELLVLANGEAKEAIKDRVEKEFNDDRIRVIYVGLSQLPYVLNFGIEKSNGEYIARMDGDDICMKTRFEDQLNYLQEHNLDFVGSDYDLIDEKGVLIREEITHHEFDVIRKRLVVGNQFCHPSILAKKTSLLKSGGYSFGFFSEDYELWIRMIFEHGFRGENINKKLLKYRIHSGQATNKNNQRRNFAYAISLSILCWLKYKNPAFLLSALWQFKLTKFIYRKLKK
ncbi:Glycosyl transferase [Vibrio chagasii]|nr:Glycosyl transferase [Vibrio chagasii]CAH7412090.1 Glycosyl transferase [Vibrio chagasii]CAH7429954.1 Glycosyl transferase [Vibrio chagasii]